MIPLIRCLSAIVAYVCIDVACICALMSDVFGKLCSTCLFLLLLTSDQHTCMHIHLLSYIYVSMCTLHICTHAQLEEVSSAKWFYSFLPIERVQHHLSGETNGTYIVTFCVDRTGWYCLSVDDVVATVAVIELILSWLLAAVCYCSYSCSCWYCYCCCCRIQYH